MHTGAENVRAEAVPKNRRLRITVLAGGPSAEREVSLDSGRAVAEALRQRGHEVFVADIAPDDLTALDHPAQVVFPALHGTFGEDGQLQKILEERNIPFVGSGSKASRLAMDKVAAKACAYELRIFTPPCEVVVEANLERVAGRARLPLVAKPVDQGSSVATFIVRQRAELEPALREIVDRFGTALVERFIEGEEITVGVLGDRALPPISVRSRRQFYDYEAKYHDAETEYVFDAGPPDGLSDDISAKSVAIYKELGCRHFARVDWIVDCEGNPWFLEVNTIPGFTSQSLMPKAAARIGIPFAELCERLVYMAERGS